MKMYNIDDTNGTVARAKSQNNDTLAILLMEAETGEEYDVSTTNIDESNIFEDQTHAFVDTNNCPWAEKFLIENKIATPMGIYGHSGYCRYPLYAFDITDIPEIQ